MKDTPILFNADNAIAVACKRKQQTRRLDGLEALNLDPNAWSFSHRQDTLWIFRYLNPRPDVSDILALSCPYGREGDLLWVRESYRFGANWDTYKPSDVPPGTDLTYERDAEAGFWGKQRPSIFMPKWACRLWLTITDIRMVRLQEINEEDAIAEGIERVDGCTAPYIAWKDYTGNRQLLSPLVSFQSLWESIHGSDAWERNDWVWAFTFQLATKPLSR